MPPRRRNRTSNQCSPSRPNRLRRGPRTCGRLRAPCRGPASARHLPTMAAPRPTQHRQRPGWRPTVRPRRPAPRRARPARPHPTAPAPGLRMLTAQGWPPAARPAAFRRFPRRPCPGPGRKTGALRESRRPRGLRRPPLTSAVLAAARLAPRPPGPAGRAHPARQPPDPRAVPRPGRARPGRRDLAPRGLARPVRAGPARRARARRVPARGRVTTPSARPRPAWARRLRRGPRVPFPASRAVPGSRRPARPVLVVPAARVPAAADREGREAGPALPTAGRVRAGTWVPVPAVPGPAR